MYEITSLGLINNLNNMKNYIRALWKLHYGLYIYEIHIINRTTRNLTNIKKCVCIHYGTYKIYEFHIYIIKQDQLVI
jgi:hypothetical protein